MKVTLTFRIPEKQVNGWWQEAICAILIHAGVTGWNWKYEREPE